MGRSYKCQGLTMRTIDTKLGPTKTILPFIKIFSPACRIMTRVHKAAYSTISKKESNSNSSNKKGPKTKIKQVNSTIKKAKLKEGDKLHKVYKSKDKNMKLFIVESPTKAKKIQEFLGKDFIVVSTSGHIRTVPTKKGMVEPDKDFLMHFKVVNEKITEDILNKAEECKEIYLATDADREGEGISWHMLELIKEKETLKNKVVKRIVFFEITKEAILDAIENIKEININLVQAQQAREALDYLLGLSLSQVLREKLPYCKSAGRVQSVALKLICEREKQREDFKPQKYWSIEGIFQDDHQRVFTLKLAELCGKKMEKFSITTEQEAIIIVQQLRNQSFKIIPSKKKDMVKNPKAAFTTSTMLQNAANQLKFAVKKTSKLAQELYEKGLITYIRTDSVNVSAEIISKTREYIAKIYGDQYLPRSVRDYKTKTKNAQEAHEAIRPTDVSLCPINLKDKLSYEHYLLYELIWNRFVASLMSSARLKQISFEACNETQTIFRATGRIIEFDGFLKLIGSYDEESNEEDEESILPTLEHGAIFNIKDILIKSHSTEAPPKFTEISLIKKLEELGIGRPSTYSNISSLLKDREYVISVNKSLSPSIRGRVVNSFLCYYFKNYVDYEYTSNLESHMDNVSQGKKDYKELLLEFWLPFNKKIQEILKTDTTQIQKQLENDLAHILFVGSTINPECYTCKKGVLHLKFSAINPFLGCSCYPACKYIKSIGIADPQLLGVDEQEYFYYFCEDLRGAYVQKNLGTYNLKNIIKKAYLPKSLPEHWVDISLDNAIFLTTLPKTLGKNDEGDKYLICNGLNSLYIKVELKVQGEKVEEVNYPYKNEDVPIDKVDLECVKNFIKNTPHPKKVNYNKTKNKKKKFKRTKKK